jgi:hypothetical protein
MTTRYAVEFVSDAGHLNAPIAGGLQACTQEYIELRDVSS